jgi:hypothetical protein
MNLMVDELSRQVKRHRDKLRKRREAHAASARVTGVPAALTMPASAGLTLPST